LSICYTMTDKKNDDLLRKVALVLKDLRSKKGVMQMDVINDTGVHMGRVETGTSNITLSSLSVLADYFEIKLSDFFKLVEKQK